MIKKLGILLSFIWFFSVSSYAEETLFFIEVVKTPATITVNLEEKNPAIFTTISGNVFAVVGETPAFYRLTLPKNSFGWIHKLDTQIISSNEVSTYNLLSPSLNAVAQKTPSANIIAPVFQNPYRYDGQENYNYPRQPKNQHLDLEVGGFYEFKISGRNYEPRSVTDSRWERIIRDPIYTKLPRDVLLGPSKLDIRYHIQIDGKLNEDLSVHYDIEQEPDFPGKYDVQVKHKQKELTFYHFDSVFQNGEFIQVNKALNGVMYTQEDAQWQTITAMGRQRSEPKKFETLGTGQTTYNLGNSSILEGSVFAWVNNKKKNEGSDFKLNYFEGKIEFFDPLQKNDFLKVVYEFTNPIEDFLPSLSRKNFFGSQFLWQSKDTYEVEQQAQTFSEQLWPIQNTVSTYDAKETLQFFPEGNEFLLTHSHVVLGSDKVLLNNEALQRNIDYFIEHREGKVILKQSLVASDTLDITYDCYLVTDYTIDLIAQNSPGAYYLPHPPILDGAATVWVDSKEKRETIDYLLDYDTGRLFFNYSLNYPDVISVTYTAIDSKVLTSNTTGTPFDFGVTYLNEYSRSNEEDLNLSIISENATITGNSLQTSLSPLINTENIVIKLGETLLTSQNYTIINPYKGLISIDPSVSFNIVVDKPVISYDYRKSLRTKFTLVGDGRGNSGENAYYIAGEEAFVLRDLPIQYNGIVLIRVYDGKSEILLANNGLSYEVDYGESGYDIKLRFIQQQGNNGSDLTFLPDADTPITIEYMYTPDQAIDPGNISQRMIGLTGGVQLNNKWDIDAELVAADHNFSRPTVSLKEPFAMQGTGVDNAIYRLSNSNLVEDSDLVFIAEESGFERLLNKGTDYIIGYRQGTLRFRNLTPGPKDTIKVYYDYYDFSGSTQAGIASPFKYATKLSSSYTTDAVTTQAHFKFIDPEFFPLSPIKEKKGNTVYGGSLDWKIASQNNFKFSYDRTNENKGDNLVGGGRQYLHHDDLTTSLTWKFFDYFDTFQDFQYRFTLEDPKDSVVTLNPHAIDSLSMMTTTKVSWGPSYWVSNLKRGNSFTFNDYIDRDTPSRTQVETRSATTSLSLPRFPLLGSITVAPNYAQSLTNTQYSSAPTASYTNRLTNGLSIKFQPKKSLAGDTLYTFQTITNKVSSTASENVNIVLNINYNLAYKPYSWFQTSWSLSHNENESLLLNQKGLIRDEERFRLSRYHPYGMITALGVRHNNVFLRPIKNTTISMHSNRSKKLENNLKKTNTRHSGAYTIQNVTPLPGLKLSDYSWEASHSSMFDSVSRLTVSENISAHDIIKKRGSLTYSPKLPVLSLFSYAYSFEDNTDYKLSRSIATHSTSNRIEDNTPYFRRSQKLTFSPPMFYLPLPIIKRLALGSFSAYANEDWEDKQSSKSTIYISPVTTANLTPTLTHPLLEEDTFLSKTYTYGVKVSPFNLFSLSGQLTSRNEVIVRNISSTPVYTDREGRNYLFSTQYSPFKFLSVGGAYSHTRSTQYVSPTFNITKGELIQAKNDQDFILFKDFINKLTISQSLNSTFAPFRFISFRGSVVFSDILQYFLNKKIVSSNAATSSLITQKTGSMGTVFSPFSGFSLSYDYSIGYSKQNDSGFQQGYGGLTSVSYSPLQTDSISVNINYTRKDSWGYGLNTLQNEGTLQGTGQEIVSEIVERKNLEELGSLSVNINIPISNSPYIQSLVIEGEGYLKKIVDFKDPPEGSFAPKNSYEISGMILKGTLRF